MYQSPDKSHFHETPEIQSQVDTGKLGAKILAKQSDFNKILEIMQRKVVQGTHLPMAIK